jgi:PRTRC genetic system protein F
LPSVSADVPIAIGGESLAYQPLAKFALAAESVGMALPGGALNSPIRIVQEQLQNWLDTQIGDNARATLSGSPAIEADRSAVRFFMNASSSLATLRLKPVIEALENVEAGLGWFVVDVIELSNGSGISVYSPRQMGYHADHHFLGAQSDLDFLVEMQSLEGAELPTGQEELAAMLNQAKSDYGLLPSLVLESVGGHRHLLGWSTPPGSKNPQSMPLSRVKALISQETLPGDLLPCVLDAVELSHLYSVDKDAFMWSYDTGDYEDEEPVGGACFIAWDDPSILMELAEHYEVHHMQSGTALECLCRLAVPASASDKDFRRFAKLICLYFKQWNALGNLLSHFPET